MHTACNPSSAHFLRIRDMGTLHSASGLLPAENSLIRGAWDGPCGPDCGGPMFLAAARACCTIAQETLCWIRSSWTIVPCVALQCSGGMFPLDDLGGGAAASLSSFGVKISYVDGKDGLRKIIWEEDRLTSLHTILTALHIADIFARCVVEPLGQKFFKITLLNQQLQPRVANHFQAHPFL